MKRAVKKPVSHHLLVDEYDQIRHPEQQHSNYPSRQPPPQAMGRDRREQEAEIHCRVCHNFIPARLFARHEQVCVEQEEEEDCYDMLQVRRQRRPQAHKKKEARPQMEEDYYPSIRQPPQVAVQPKPASKSKRPHSAMNKAPKPTSQKRRDPQPTNTRIKKTLSSSRFKDEQARPGGVVASRTKREDPMIASAVYGAQKSSLPLKAQPLYLNNQFLHSKLKKKNVIQSKPIRPGDRIPTSQHQPQTKKKPSEEPIVRGPPQRQWQPRQKPGIRSRVESVDREERQRRQMRETREQKEEQERREEMAERQRRERMRRELQQIRPQPQQARREQRSNSNNDEQIMSRGLRRQEMRRAEREEFRNERRGEAPSRSRNNPRRRGGGRPRGGNRRQMGENLLNFVEQTIHDQMELMNNQFSMVSNIFQNLPNFININIESNPSHDYDFSMHSTDSYSDDSELSDSLDSSYYYHDDEEEEGLRDEEIDSIARQRFDRQRHGEHQCTICLTDIGNGETIKKLYCDHVFHDECIDEWLRRKSACPVCRDRLG